MNPQAFDVIVIGGGPAGLSAALMLGRARRRVVVIDEGRPRNAASRGVHGFLSRDGIAPSELLRISREQLEKYQTIHLVAARADDVRRLSGGFEVVVADGSRFHGRKLILATGVVDELPPVEGLKELYGRSVFHCPYCDGWEVRDQPLAVYGHDDEHGGELALELTLWSRDLILCTDGVSELSDECRDRLARNGVNVRDERIERLEGADGILERIVFERGEPLARRAMFLWCNPRQSIDLARRLGCDMEGPEGFKADSLGRTSVPGLFVIGDASRDVLQVAVAAGEGSQAASTVNRELLEEELR